MQNKKDYYMSENGISTFELIKYYLNDVLMFENIGTSECWPRINNGFLVGNIIKYLARNGKKENAKDDLEKAKHYAEIYLEEILDATNGKFLRRVTRDDIFSENDKFHTTVIQHLIDNNLSQAQSDFNEWREEVERKMLNNN